MAVRFYLVPLEEGMNPGSGNPVRGPKYFAWPYDPDPPALVMSVPWEMRDYGREPTALLAADLSPGDHALVAGMSDVTAVPVNLDAQVGANLATVQTALESLNIPADTLLATHTYRQVLRGVMAIFALAQRFNGRLGQAGRLFPSGVTFATTLGDLSQTVREELKEAAQSLGYDYSGLTGASTMRDVLKAIARQQSPSPMLGVIV